VHSPDPGSEQDRLLLSCIRHINLDSYLSRALSTDAGNRDRVKMFMSLSNMVRLRGPFVYDGTFGYKEAGVRMVLASRHLGKHSVKILHKIP
jgi:hypothetical protein